ncbi:class I adenylate-forming enzyme family protein [Mycolicibacterium lutetiense]|jgi:acyl-CoA synthetase|uniref:Acyl-CoA synthetase n=1 Tax=Mycolicibacterium lutetiense TaxID=1641992 RepID=A0ABS4ZPS9_9MYCO|nr:class I adenylate-forming enzyme family protein [Mycolicibacterium lutetiense]MBP2451196.1 acyl-CoA synthetase [Mycolicibacterium lutetiense]
MKAGDVAPAADAAHYRAAGWWSDRTLSQTVREHALTHPDKPAYIDYPATTFTWSEFDCAASLLAAQLAGLGIAPGDRIAVWHGDTAAIHVLFVAIERCGAVVVGIGARAGTREATQILRTTAPRLLISDAARQVEARSVASGLTPEISALVLDGLSLDTDTPPRPPAAGVGADDVFLINSTSGTTGLPKCVVHTQNRWHYFHQQAVANGALTSEDVFLPVIPAPFGFGIWTAHTTPIYLGVTTVLLEKFDAAAACEAIARHRVSVLCCVSTQLMMIMADRASREHDLSSLRVVFTGGEALPYQRAADFEELTGATILQFYGSNETGLLSGTTLHDSRERRLRTAGRLVPEMTVRLFDGDDDVTSTGRGQPACRGPATSLGYLGGVDHDKLYTPDGWMRMGDVCEVDAEGYLSVTGRTSDFIVRGGKNISAGEVEDAVTTHPAVAVAAAVAMPDPVFGEKVCVYIEQVAPVAPENDEAIDLPGLVEHLLAQGMSKELLPEKIIVLDELPRSSGGKIAKGQLREDIRIRLGDSYERR